MKKLFISALSLLAVALGFTACTSDDDPASTPETPKLTTVYATTEQPSATRTALGEGNDTDGYSVVWSAGDQIKFGTTNDYVFTLKSGAGTTTGEFEGTAPTTDSDAYLVFYPADYNGKMPTEQTYVENNIPQGVPMQATKVSVKHEGDEVIISPISFKNVGGILRLNLKGEAKVTSITISATNLTNPITLNCGSTGVQLNTTTATPFHIAVPGTDAGTAYTGLKIEITDDASAVCTKTAKQAITVARSMITNINLTLAAGSFVAPEPSSTTGKAKATIAGVETDVNWVQLWEDGPKFAEYNVGVTDGKAESYGGYYCWGSANDENVNYIGNYGSDDIASTVWGNNWRTPVQEELQALIEKCTLTWTSQNEVEGLLLTGKDAYSSNSIFIPAAGIREANGLDGPGSFGNYWSSTLNEDLDPYCFVFTESSQTVTDEEVKLYDCLNVRAVLKDENDPIPAGSRGTAKANIGGEEVDVNWVQLTPGGPKFAEYNVGVTDGKAESYGGYYAWGGIVDKGDDYNTTHTTSNENLTSDEDTAARLWGKNWRMPTVVELEALLEEFGTKLEWIDGVTKKYKDTNATGLLCTGIGAYSCNSIFLPASGDCSSGEVGRLKEFCEYWSSTSSMEQEAYYMSYDKDSNSIDIYDGGRDYGQSVRAVLVE